MCPLSMKTTLEGKLGVGGAEMCSHCDCKQFERK